MNVNEWLRLIAGAFVLLSVILGAIIHPAWNYFAAFVAVNLIQSSFHPPAPGVVSFPRSALVGAGVLPVGCALHGNRLVSDDGFAPGPRGA
jgi:hypothetical protein